jgi:PAS domain S-box-containing protein
MTIRDLNEHKPTERLLAESEEQYRLLIMTMAEGVTLQDENSVIIAHNKSAERILGLSSEQLNGRTSLDLCWYAIHEDGSPFPGETHPVVMTLKTGLPQSNVIMGIHKSEGELTWISVNVQPIFKEGQTTPYRVVATMRDITERKLAEVSLIKSNRAIAALSAVNHSLVHSTEEHELLLAVCQAIVRQGNYRMVWVGYLEQDAAKSVRPVAQDGFEENYLELAALTWADTEYGRGPIGRAARSGQTQVVQNIQTDAGMLSWRAEAEKSGLASIIALPLTNAGKVFGVLTIYSVYIDAFGEEEISLLEQMAGDLVFGINSLRTRQERDIALKENKHQLAQLQDNLEGTVKAITKMVEMRDPYTAGHEVRVAELATAIAKEMGLTDEQVHGIHLGGMVHDLGKIQIPAEILSMPRRLTEIEYGLIKIHPQAGYNILKDIDFPWPIAQMVLQHHERIDGSGYPQGLKGESILIEARILCVADVVEAMSAHRPYRPGLGIEAALNEIKKGSGTIYDTEVVDVCLKLFGEGRFKF